MIVAFDRVQLLSGSGLGQTRPGSGPGSGSGFKVGFGSGSESGLGLIMHEKPFFKDFCIHYLALALL